MNKSVAYHQWVIEKHPVVHLGNARFYEYQAFVIIFKNCYIEVAGVHPYFDGAPIPIDAAEQDTEDPQKIIIKSDLTCVKFSIDPEMFGVWPLSLKCPDPHGLPDEVKKSVEDRIKLWFDSSNHPSKFEEFVLPSKSSNPPSVKRSNTILNFSLHNPVSFWQVGRFGDVAESALAEVLKATRVYN